MHAIEQESRRQDDVYDVRDDRERIRSHKPNFSILRYKEKRVIPKLGGIAHIAIALPQGAQ